MATGFPPGKLTEIIDLKNASSKCEYNGNPPNPNVYKGVGGFLFSDTPMVCTGELGGRPYKIDCSILGDSQDLEAPRLKEARIKAASVVVSLEQTLWITGGYDGSKVLLTTERITPGTPSESGPALPHPIYGHCMVTLGDNDIMVIGGYTGATFPTETSTYDITDWDTAAPKAGPNLRMGNEGMGCGLLTTDDTGKYVVVVAGGSRAGSEQNIEVWFVDQGANQNFVSKGQLPFRWYNGEGVTYMNSLILVGNQDSTNWKKILRITCSSGGCQHEVMSQALKDGRYENVAMLIPENFVNCTQTI